MKNFAAFVLLIVTILCSSCTTYVPVQQGQQYPQQQQYQYDPGYNPNNVLADAILASAIINGVSGYYGPGHIFYRQSMYGGVPGYYVGGVFHTSGQYRTTIVNNYNTGRNEYQRNPQSYAQANPTAVKTVNGGPGKPSYGSQTQASSSRMPNYSNAAGGVQRGSSAPSQNAMPNYGSNSGGVSRSPSFGSSSRSSSSSSSSSSRSSTRR
jgi:hypothetical protein